MKRKGYNNPRGGNYKRPRARGPTLTSPQAAITRQFTSAQINQILKSSGELKGIDVQIGQNPIGATTDNSNIVLLNPLQAGTAPYNRVGNKVHNQSLRIKGIIQGTYAIDDDQGGNTAVRVTVVHDNQPGTAIPAFGDIFADHDAVGTKSVNMLSNVDLSQTSRFKVIRDKVFILPTPPQLTDQTNGQTTEVNLTFDEFMLLKDMPTQYDGTANPITVSNMTSGAFYVVYRVVATAGADTVVAIKNAISRLRYKD